MSVQDPEPKIPNDDTGKGLRIVGVLLLLWTLFSLIWVPPRLFWSTYWLVANGACLVTGLVLVIAGYITSWLAPSDSELSKRTHDLMECTHCGGQNDEPLFANRNGPGLPPTKAA